MLDIRWIRDNPDAFDAGLKRRGLAAMAAELKAADERHRKALTALQEAQARRNEASKQIGAAKAKREDAAALIAEVAQLKDEIAHYEAEAAAGGEAVERVLATIPNIPATDVPDGADETANQVVRTVGTPPKFDFPPREHDAIGERLGLMDFERAAKLSGARFVVLKGGLARMERALSQFMLDLQTGEFGYTEVSPPLLVRDETAFGTG